MNGNSLQSGIREEVAAVEVVGWYCGMPNDEDTEYYKDKGVRAVLE